jgi:hypothetical protein
VSPPANYRDDRDDRDRIFEIVKERAPGFADYEKRTDRVIPVFELDTDA